MSMAASLLAFKMTRLIVVMGVAGCGKSTIAEGLALGLDGTYLDADAFHPAKNIAKMSAGHPLTDDDRWPWLDQVGIEIARKSGRVIGACSALRRVYRERITSAAREPVTFAYLAGSRDLIASRMAARDGHFMPLSLLDSQFATLEVPDPDETAIDVDISGDEHEVIAHLVRVLQGAWD